jgi:D-glycero-D-manno-heptose 1,7-bisphosphate phosphatase
MHVQLVILDRHGLINAETADPIDSEHDWQAIPGSLETLARLSGAGYRLVVASNEPGLQRKQFDIESLISIHHRIQHDLLEVGGSLDAVFFCSCPPKGECDCMMPNPRMLNEIAERLRTSLDGIPVISSLMATIQAARAAGARPILISGGRDLDAESGASVDGIECYDDLAAAVDSLLAEAAQV